MKHFIQLFIYLSLPLMLGAQSHFVQESGQFVLEEGYLVLDNSHFTNNATVSGTNGTLKMSGAAADANTTIGGSGSTTLSKLEIAKTLNNVRLGQAISVSEQLILSGGLLDLTNFDLTLLKANNAAMGAANNRYVKTSGSGQLKMTVGSVAQFFPVGNTSYNPATLTNVGTTDVLGIRVEDQAKIQLPAGANAQTSTVNRIWQIKEAITGGSNLSINLGWQAAEELSTFNRSKTHFAHYNAMKWVAKNNGAATGNNLYSFTGTNISTLGAFSLGNVGCEATSILGTPPPTVANAGMDMLAICGEATLLTGNQPTIGTGNWSIISGDNKQLLDSAIDPMSMLSGSIGEQYTLEWTIKIDNPICPASKDRVLIGFDADTDSDMVQDCVDLCEGSNDSDNQDGDLIPDGCDCLPAIINDIVVEDGDPSLNGYITPGLYTANEKLTSNGKVFGAGGSFVEFKAGDCVLLEPGFHAEVGSEFIANIGLCEPNATLLADATLSKAVIEKVAPIDQTIDFTVFPNPFSIKSKINIELSTPQAVSVGVYNQTGRLIRRLLVNQYLEGGHYDLGLNGDQLEDGFYYIAVFTNSTQLVKKVVVHKADAKGGAMD